MSLIFFDYGPQHAGWSWLWVLWCLSIAKVPYSLLEDAMIPVQTLVLSTDPDGRHLVESGLKQTARCVEFVLAASILCALGALALDSVILGYASVFIFLLMTRPIARLFCAEQKLRKTFAVTAMITTITAIFINATMLHGRNWNVTFLHVLLSWAAAEMLPWVILLCVGMTLAWMGKI